MVSNTRGTHLSGRTKVWDLGDRDDGCLVGEERDLTSFLHSTF